MISLSAPAASMGPVADPLGLLSGSLPKRPGSIYQEGRRLRGNHGTKTEPSVDYAIVGFPDLIQSISFNNSLYSAFRGIVQSLIKILWMVLATAKDADTPRDEINWRELKRLRLEAH